MPEITIYTHKLEFYNLGRKLRGGNGLVLVVAVPLKNLNLYVTSMIVWALSNQGCQSATIILGKELHWTLHIILQLLHGTHFYLMAHPQCCGCFISEENLTNPYPLDFPDTGWHITFTVTRNHQFRWGSNTKITRTDGFHDASLRTISLVP
jgi:hypothetical protein